MSKTDDKKKKGVAIIIAVGGKPPKPPTKTLDPDEKKKSVPMDAAWRMLKNEPTHCPIHGDELQMIGDPGADEFGPSWCPTCAELPRNEMGEQVASVLGER